jgi:two-component sensor histidine kinase
MTPIWDWLFNPSGLTPHGFCLSWAPGLVATHVVADAIIGLSYFSIPLAISAFVRQRPDIRYSWVAYLFVAFILACGSTHLWAILTLWVPAYGMEAVIKVITAALSIATAALLWPLIPKLVALPSAAQLERVNASLAERVAERTAELEAVNARLTEALADRTRALTQRDLLLREVYHRVKNNLQIIDGMLAMQSRQLDDGHARGAMANMRGRVYALGLVHHQLMESQDLETFDMAPFLRELADNIVQGGPTQGVELSVAAAPLPVGLDLGIPLGLIVTELVTNSLKHAFPDGKGRIEVSLSRAEDGGIALAVADNGQGYAPDAIRVGSLGGTIIEGLVAQLGGTMTVRHGKGVRTEITVPGASA